MDFKSIYYLAYLGTALPLTVAVGRTLHRNGRVFLVDAFHGNEPLADSVNHLLVVGFYLVNCGWAVQNMAVYGEVRDHAEVLEHLADGVGTVLLVLGGMHFFNLWVLSRLRKKGLAHMEPPPVLPNEFLPPRRAAVPA
jgi:hypothetical protein